MIEFFIIIGGCYALYVCGMAIATELDYREVNRHKRRKIRWSLQKLEKTNLNYLSKNLGGYSMDSKTENIWLEEGLLRNEIREKILQRCEILRYMGDDGISCIFDQLPDHELVEDCGWVLDKAHDDLDNLKLGLIRS